MKGRIIVGISFKYSPLLSVYPFLCCFFRFPLFSSLQSLFHILIWSLAHGIQGQRGLLLFFFKLYHKGQDFMICIPRQAWPNQGMAQSRPNQGMMVKWTRLIFSSLQFFHFLHPYPRNLSDPWSYCIPFLFFCQLIKIFAEVFTNVELL